MRQLFLQSQFLFSRAPARRMFRQSNDHLYYAPILPNERAYFSGHFWPSIAARKCVPRLFNTQKSKPWEEEETFLSDH